MFCFGIAPLELGDDLISASDSSARYGFMALHPYPNSRAKWWTSRGSPDSTIMSACVPVFSRMRWWCTAPVASNAGMYAFSESIPRSDSMSIVYPSFIARDASARILSNACLRAFAPPLTGNSVDIVRDLMLWI